MSLMSLNVDILFYYRYVDDICTAVSPSKIDIWLQRFNSFHLRLQFTIKIEEEKLDFLNTAIFISNNRFVFDWQP